MFNWTTTTIINKLPEKFIETVTKGKDTVKGVRIGNKLFEKRWVESIRKAEGHEYELCEAQVDLSKVQTAIEAIAEENRPTVARLYIYVGLEGSEESIYANDWYRKGMPLSVSFPVSKYEVGKDDDETQANKEAAAADMATAIVDTVDKFNVFTKVKKVLDVTAKGSILTIKGTHEHQRLQKIAILVGDGGIIGEERSLLTTWELSECRYQTTKGAKAQYEAKTGVKLVRPGVNGFGTYSQLTKDLSLPTAAHTHWTSVTKDERPVIGEVYTQYIITYYAPSTANPSFTAVGNRSMSETTHVFWVKSTEVENWENAIAAIDPEGDKFDTGEVVVTEVTKTTVNRASNKKKSLVEKVESLVERVETLETLETPETPEA